MYPYSMLNKAVSVVTSERVQSQKVHSRSFCGTFQGTKAIKKGQEIPDNQLYEQKVFEAIVYIAMKNYAPLKAAKYQIQKPSTCHATLFCCKFWSMFRVFHLA